MGGVRYCYEQELARDPELGGKVTMMWQIGLDGKVIKAWADDTSSSLKNNKVKNCMKRSVKRWRFPKPDGGICQVRYPFMLNSGI